MAVLTEVLLGPALEARIITTEVLLEGVHIMVLVDPIITTEVLLVDVLMALVGADMVAGVTEAMDVGTEEAGTMLAGMEEVDMEEAAMAGALEGGTPRNLKARVSETTLGPLPGVE